MLLREILVVLGDLRYSKRNKLNKKVKGMWPKMNRSRRAAQGLPGEAGPDLGSWR